MVAHILRTVLQQNYARYRCGQRRSVVAMLSISSNSMVLAAHGPDKGVIRCTYAAVDAPGRADDRVIVVHDNMAGLGAAHRTCGKRPGPRGPQSRCRSPCGARGCGWAWCSSCCLAPGQVMPMDSWQVLSTLGWMNWLMVRLLQVSRLPSGTLGGLIQGDQLGLVAAVCRGGDHVELGRMLRSRRS